MIYTIYIYIHRFYLSNNQKKTRTFFICPAPRQPRTIPRGSQGGPFLGRVTSSPCSRKRMGRSSNLGGFRAGAWDTVQLGRRGLRDGANGLRYQNIHACMVTENVEICVFSCHYT